jgi:hypothetical protein
MGVHATLRNEDKAYCKIVCNIPKYGLLRRKKEKRKKLHTRLLTVLNSSCP